MNGENSNKRDLAQILVYLGNGLLVSQFYRMLHQDIKILIILLFIYCLDVEIRLKYIQMIKITGDMQIMSNLGI